PRLIRRSTAEPSTRNWTPRKPTRHSSRSYVRALTVRWKRWRKSPINERKNDLDQHENFQTTRLCARLRSNHGPFKPVPFSPANGDGARFFCKTVMLKSAFRFFDRARRARQSLTQPSPEAS